MSPAVLFTAAERWRYPNVHEWVKDTQNMARPHTGMFLSRESTNSCCSGKDLEHEMLSERSQM